MDFDFVTETITPESSTSLTIGNTGSLILPMGTTGERPAAGAGKIRYNSSLGTLEYYDTGDSTWHKLSAQAADLIGSILVANGGTGQSSFTDGQLLIGNTSGNTLTKSTLTASTGVEIVNGNGTIALSVDPTIVALLSELGTAAFVDLNQLILNIYPIDVSSNYTIDHTDNGKCLNTSGTTTITLLSALSIYNANAPFCIIIKSQDASSVTIAPDGTDTIDGSNSSIVLIPGTSAILIPTSNSSWITLNRQMPLIVAPTPRGTAVIDFGNDASTAQTLMSGGAFHSLGIKGGKLYAWGRNVYGRLGDGTTVGKSSPVQIGTETDWSQVTGGGLHSLGIKSGKLYAWGSNAIGQLGNGTTSNSNAPIQIGSKTDWSQISAGDNHTLGIRSGRLYAWGGNSFGQLGDNTIVEKSSPIRIGSKTDWSQISAGKNNSSGIRGGKLYNWGLNNTGQLGNGTTSNKSSPIQIGSKTNWTYTKCGNGHWLGLATNKLYACGSNSSGQLGDGTTVNKSSPVRVGTGVDWSQISAGRYHSLGIKNGQFHTWGAAGDGILGDGTIVAKSSPVQIGNTTTPSNNEASVVVTGQTSILSTSLVSLNIPSDIATSDHTTSDHKYITLLVGLSSSTPVAGTGFTIYARSLHKLTGTFNINWSWI